MARVSTYLNFPGTAEEAFEHYRKLFGTDYAAPIVRYSDMPDAGVDVASDEQRLVMNAQLAITAGHVLMATDLVPSLGQTCRVGNNTTIFVELDDRAEVDRLFAGLRDDADTELFAPQDVPWGQYWGTCLDRFGIRWMLATYAP